MMVATIDVGSNTLRMLLGQFINSKIQPNNYYQQITRLSGGYCDAEGLAAVSMERTLGALLKFKAILEKQPVVKVRIVGTAALRRASNRQLFVAAVKERTGFTLEIISGDEEARLTAAGVLSVLDPLPKAALIVDIGGGSTELICFAAKQMLLAKSYPLGVVRLSEECASQHERQRQIATLLESFVLELQALTHLSPQHDFELVGTAGTISTLAAMRLQLKNYDRRKINNLRLAADWLVETRHSLEALSVAQREDLIGMEPGRGDLILPGLEILLALLKRFSKDSIRVVDAGLLEGAMLDLGRH